jgi:lipoprotein NlpD
MGTSTVQQTPQIQPVQRPVSQPTQIQPVEQPVQTENGRIVYNRQYGNIPKGSYTGGSTYTVKRGDTLFYIAWITGNDFRDLAQRNNVQAPYGLEVGKRSRWQRDRYATTPGNTVSAADVTAQNNSVKPAQKSTTVVASQPVITYSEDSGDQSANKMLPNNKGTATTVTAPVTAPVVSSMNRLPAV